MALGPGQVEPSHDLWCWAEPLAFDALRALYRNRIEDTVAAEWLARQHVRIWHQSAQGILVDDQISELEGQLAQYGQDMLLILDANAAVAAEIAETIHLRFRRDLKRLGAYALTLDDIAYSMRQAEDRARRA